MNRPLVFVLLATLCTTTTACPEILGKACTEIGCLDGFDLTFDKASAWEAGVWTVVADMDGDVVTCTTTLPFDDTSLGGCDAEGVYLTLSGTELSADQQSVEGLTVERTDFVRLTVTLSLDGSEVATETFEPEWTTSEPNGPDCPPECTFDANVMSF